MLIEYYASNLARYADLNDIKRIKLENQLIEPLIDIIQKTVLPTKAIQKITVYYKYTTGWNDYSKDDSICENFSLHRLELINFIPTPIIIYIQNETVIIETISIYKSLCIELYNPNFIENFQKLLNEIIF